MFLFTTLHHITYLSWQKQIACANDIHVVFKRSKFLKDLDRHLFPGSLCVYELLIKHIIGCKEEDIHRTSGLINPLKKKRTNLCLWFGSKDVANWHTPPVTAMTSYGMFHAGQSFPSTLSHSSSKAGLSTGHIHSTSNWNDKRCLSSGHCCTESVIFVEISQTYLVQSYLLTQTHTRIYRGTQADYSKQPITRRHHREPKHQRWQGLLHRQSD